MLLPFAVAIWSERRVSERNPSWGIKLEFLNTAGMQLPCSF